jgi:hypothetical protein
MKHAKTTVKRMAKVPLREEHASCAGIPRAAQVSGQASYTENTSAHVSIRQHTRAYPTRAAKGPSRITSSDAVSCDIVLVVAFKESAGRSLGFPMNTV